MSLHRWIREYVEKYSFITKTEFKGAIFYIYYEKEGKSKHKKLPYRSTKEQLQTLIESIKKDINYYDKRINDIKSGKYSPKKQDMAFLHSSGETK